MDSAQQTETETAEPLVIDSGLGDGLVHFKDGRFFNPWSSFEHRSPLKLMRPSFLRDMHGVSIPKGDDAMPVHTPDWDAIKQWKGDGVQTTWLGHACVLVKMDGMTILTDPVFSKRCSASQWVGPARFTAFPGDHNDIPYVDVVLISHNHYDHLDYNSLMSLKDRVGLWCVPIGLKRWLNKCGVKNCVELDWWQETSISLTPPSSSSSSSSSPVRIVCTPAQHFSGRMVFDNAKTLWCSWCVVGPTKRFFFGGDTGYRAVPRVKGEEEPDVATLDQYPHCPAFKRIGDKLGPFDMAAIPIGAYSPRWFMSPIHVCPEDAVCIHQDINSRKSLGVHWGTWTLTVEPVMEPPQRLAAELKRKQLDPQSFVVLEHGQTLHC